MIASKCILSVFPGNDVSHVPLRKARGWTVNHLWQWCWGQHNRKGTGSCRTMAKEVQCLARSREQARPAPSSLLVNLTYMWQQISHTPRMDLFLRTFLPLHKELEGYGHAQRNIYLAHSLLRPMPVPKSVPRKRSSLG